MHKLKPNFNAPLQQILAQVPKTKTLVLYMFILYMLKAGLISCWNKKQNTKSYLSANKHSGLDLTLSFHTNLSCANCCFVGCSVSMRQTDIGVLKRPSAIYMAKRWIDEVTVSRMLNEASSESK